MAENYRQPHLSTADIAQQQTEENRVGQDREMERVESPDEERSMPLLPSDDTDNFQSRWDAIQAEFVDDPSNAVEAADTLVAQVMKRMAEMFTEERGRLEAQWRRGEEVSTEDLRVALQRYRSFFHRLLTLK
jgi:hypothetical protein